MFRKFFFERSNGSIHTNAQKPLKNLRISHAFDSDPETRISATVPDNPTGRPQRGENRREYLFSVVGSR